MKTETIRIRVEADLKAQAESVLQALGLKSSEAIRMFYRQIVMQGGLPFSAKVPNYETLQAIFAKPEPQEYENFPELLSGINEEIKANDTVS